jgi:hypothetical protein
MKIASIVPSAKWPAKGLILNWTDNGTSFGLLFGKGVPLEQSMQPAAIGALPFQLHAFLHCVIAYWSDVPDDKNSLFFEAAQAVVGYPPCSALGEALRILVALKIWGQA